MKKIPKINNMTEEERKAWEEELNKINFDNHRKDAHNKIKQGRGWIF